MSISIVATTRLLREGSWSKETLRVIKMDINQALHHNLCLIKSAPSTVIPLLLYSSVRKEMCFQILGMSIIFIVHTYTQLQFNSKQTNITFGTTEVCKIQMFVVLSVVTISIHNMHVMQSMHGNDSGYIIPEACIFRT